MSQVKVVELNIAGSSNSKLLPVVHTIRQKSKQQLNELLQNLFNNTDDALFELADRSQSDQHQEMYFDSMRMIRLHRETFAKSFMSSFYDSFVQALTVKQLSEDTEEASSEETNYTLLDQDELEMSVAVSGIVSKVTSQYSLLIMQLTKRLGFLTKTQSITEQANPLGPHAISTAFADALSGLDVDIKIRIILMKLFERFVMERLGPVYESANRALIEAGVLPELKNSVPSREKSRVKRSDQSSSARTSNTGHSHQSSGTSENQNNAAFSSVQSLLANIREKDETSRPSTGLGAHANNTHSGSQTSEGDVIMLPTLESNDLVKALSQIQTDNKVEKIDIERIPELSDVRTLILSQSSAKEKSLGQADDDTVNFIGMLFDYILNDRNLAIPMKALIGRLQIPIVKLAIIDKSFFEKTAHPARALLNELSSAGIGWSSAQELKRDALYNKIESVVLRVLNEFNDNSDVFAELLKDLRAYVSKDVRRSVLVEQRVKESEVGKATTHGAKLQVQNLVNQKACGLRLPSEAGKFISETWSRVLTLRIVKHGESSSAWNDGVATLDNLLWTLQPLSELSDVAERDRCTEKLLADVLDGMTELGCTVDETEHFHGWLQEHLRSLSGNDRAYLEEDERPSLNIQEELIQEIVLAAPALDLADQDIDPESINTLKLITEGTWVEIEAEKDRKIRCKLATITQPGSNYIFVNRRGMKVLEQSAGQLAELIKTDHLKLIDESQVFDRALQSVIGNLRQLQRKRSG